MNDIDIARKENHRTIVLLHGAGVNRKWWHPQMNALSRDFRVIVPDLLGHGSRSGIPFSLEAAATELAALIKREADDKALVAGISLGGYVAMMHAYLYPMQTVGLVLSGCSVNMNGLRGSMFKMTGLMLKIQGVKKITEGTLRGFRKRVPTEIIEPVIEAGLNIETAMGAFGKVAGKDYFKMMRAYPKPVLILNGREDEISRKGEQKFLASLPNGRLKILDNASHLINLEQPEAFNNEVCVFANQLTW